MAGKIITIDWPTIAALPSDTYHMICLNKQQAAILNALCEYQHWKTRWDNLELTQDELDRMMGDIEFRLMSNEECMSIDYEALKQSIAEGIYIAGNDFAKQLISGRTTDFSVGTDGTVTQGDAPLPEPEVPVDDPATPFDETLMAKAGGVINVRLTIQAIFNDIAAWHFGARTEAEVVDLLNLLYGLEGAEVATFVTFWYTVDATPDTPPLLDDELDSYFFCRGLSSQSFAKYSEKFHTPTTDRATLLKFVPVLTQSLLNEWFETGIDTGSTDYLNYSCVPVPDYSLTIQWSGAVINDTHTLKKNHRYLIKASGYLIDPDGDIQDAWWHVVAATGIQSFDTTDFNIQQGGALKIDPTIFEAPYNAAHVYSWTLDMGTINANPQWGIVRDAIMAVGSTSPTGGLLIEVHDLGEIGI